MSSNNLKLGNVSSNNTLKKYKTPKSRTLKIKSHPQKHSILNFKIKFEAFFKEHDKLEDYQVSNEMIQPYLLKNGFSGITADKWLLILKSNRYLLYLDQFITFNYYTVLFPEMTIKDFITEYYYDLYIAKKINTKIKKIESQKITKLIKIYSHEIYKGLKKLISQFNIGENTQNITDTAIIQAHGRIDLSTSYCVVPQNIIIAFTTPFNKYQNITTNPLNIINSIFEITNYEIQNNSSFTSNPACSFRSDNCLKNTVYYYPGQIIPNYDLTFDISRRQEKDFGFYTDINTNKKEDIFEKGGISFYQTSICDIFSKSIDSIQNKIIYINSCRKCDNVLDHINTEFLYRYEHIITFINIMACGILDETNYNLCNPETFNFIKHIEDESEPMLTGDNVSQNLFFDTALSFAFKENKIKKPLYFGSNPEKWQATLRMLNTLNDNEKLEYTLEIYTYLINMMSRHPELYSQRLLELFADIRDNPSKGFDKFFKKHDPISIMVDLVKVDVAEEYKNKINAIVAQIQK